tara:strand:- start:1801 stop:2154 length:354 start_codon:yes stop_codon:yes gene_type:complete
MFCIVKVSGSLAVGDVVSWDSSSSSFGLASNLSTPLGVVSEAAKFDDEYGSYFASVIFAGIAWAKCSRSIPDQGGELQVENGKVYVDNNANGAGIISPLPKGQSSRELGELVMIHIR